MLPQRVAAFIHQCVHHLVVACVYVYVGVGVGVWVWGCVHECACVWLHS